MRVWGGCGVVCVCVCWWWWCVGVGDGGARAISKNTRAGATNTHTHTHTHKHPQTHPQTHTQTRAHLREHALFVLDAVRLVDDDVAPVDALEVVALLDDHLVARDAHVKRAGRHADVALLLALLRVAVELDRADRGAEAAELVHPVAERRLWHDHEVRACFLGFCGGGGGGFFVCVREGWGCARLGWWLVWWCGGGGVWCVVCGWVRGWAFGVMPAGLVPPLLPPPPHTHAPLSHSSSLPPSLLTGDAAVLVQVGAEADRLQRLAQALWLSVVWCVWCGGFFVAWVVVRRRRGGGKTSRRARAHAHTAYARPHRQSSAHTARTATHTPTHSKHQQTQQHAAAARIPSRRRGCR